MAAADDHTPPLAALAEPPRRRLRRILTRQVLASISAAVARRMTAGEAAAEIVAVAECYAAVLAELDLRAGGGQA